MDWYRRKTPQESQQNWQTWTEEGKKSFLERSRQLYPEVFAGHFPVLNASTSAPSADLSNSLQKVRGWLIRSSRRPFRSLELQTVPRLMILMPNLTDTRTCNVVSVAFEHLYQCGWEFTLLLAEYSPRYWELSHFTPDIFILDHFLDRRHYLVFMLYMISSRYPDVVALAPGIENVRLFLAARIPFARIVRLAELGPLHECI
jgi:hypothetical protein